MKTLFIILFSKDDYQRSSIINSHSNILIPEVTYKFKLQLIIKSQLNEESLFQKNCYNF